MEIAEEKQGSLRSELLDKLLGVEDSGMNDWGWVLPSPV